MADMQIAKTILEQLGGNQFLAMTGAKNLTSGENFLSFRLPMKTRDGANYWKIKLMPSDTYDIETMSVRGLKVTPKTQKYNIYNDQLRGIFEDITGLRTSLTKVYGR